MAEKNKGVNFYDLLTLSFIVLKLTHFIDWGWIVVLSPKILNSLFNACIITYNKHRSDYES